MSTVVFDIETSDLDWDSKLHCMSWYDGTTMRTVHGENDVIVAFLANLNHESHTLIGHNITTFDLPFLLHRLQDKRIRANVVDTLLLSRAKFPHYKLHKLETWSERLNRKGLGNLKVGVTREQFVEGERGLMQRRCEEDVRINTTLFNYLCPQGVPKWNEAGALQISL